MHCNHQFASNPTQPSILPIILPLENIIMGLVPSNESITPRGLFHGCGAFPYRQVMSDSDYKKDVSVGNHLTKDNALMIKC